MSPSILLVDDDIEIIRSLGRFFRRREWSVSSALDAEEGLRTFEEDRPEVVVLDLDLPGIGGLEALEILGRRDPTVAVVMLTGHGDVPTAVEAMRAGAENFLTKPVELAHLEAVVERAREKARLRRENRKLARRLADPGRLEALGSSTTMREIARQAELLARAGDTTVLLLGESGTGKGWLARIVHNLSPRAAEPFVDINCAGLSATFLESELFGHEKGAFTDAKSRKEGLLEMADGGTVFLDEVGDLDLQIQPKLLKVLEEKRFRRLGGTEEITVDVRLVAASNRDLEAEVEEGRFREDLYYRLNVMPLRLPALRERSREDVLDLVHRFFEDLRKRIGPRELELSEEATELLLAYRWPGNVRELRNVLERAVILAGGSGRESVTPDHLPEEVRAAERRRRPGEPGYRPATLEEVEKRQVARALRYREGNRTRAAEDLGISRVTLYEKMRRYGLEDVGREEPAPEDGEEAARSGSGGSGDGG